MNREKPMTRRRQKGGRNSDEKPGTKSRYKESIVIQNKTHLDAIATKFHRHCSDKTLQRMFGVAKGQVHLEDLADCYQTGFTAFYLWLDTLRENGQSLEISGNDETDGWLKVSYCFFKYPVIRLMKQQIASLEKVSYTDGDAGMEPVADVLASDEEVMADEFEMQLAELPKLVNDSITASLSGKEAIVFSTFLLHANEFDRRSLFDPLVKFVQKDHNLQLSREEIKELWRSGREKLKNHLISMENPILRDRIGDKSNVRRKESGPQATPTPTG
jgi:hypothetical protein